MLDTQYKNSTLSPKKEKKSIFVMSLRGLKFQFEVGEAVICFEPDSTKARVLYNAKVLDLIVGRSNDGTRQSEYLVHFQGWNSSWDRVVPETLILRSTEENRNLMKLIASAARKIKTNRQRKRKIEILLKKHFRGHSDFIGESSSNNDIEKRDNDTETEEETEGDQSTDSDDSDDEISFRNRTLTNGITEDDTDSQEEIDETETSPHNVQLELPENLKRKLEDDCYFICKKNKLIQLPSCPNVIAILEGYVKNFTANLVYDTNEKNHSRQERHSKPRPHRNVELLKEVADGLRVLFDFTLPDILLYNKEQDEHKRVINNYIHSRLHINTTVTPNLSEVEKPAEAVVYSPRLRSSRGHSQTTPQQSGPSSSVTSPCTSPKSQKTSPRSSVYTKHEISQDNILDDFTPQSPSSPARRITRNVFSDFARKRGFSESSRSETEAWGGSSREKRHQSTVDLGEEASTSSISSPEKRRESFRGGRCERHRSHRESRSGDNTSLTDRVVAPPPLNVSSNSAGLVSSKDSTTSSQNTPSQPSDSSSSLVYCNGYKTKEAALNHIYAWSLIPQSVYEASPTPPSVIYGAHHLLRLFVKLPDLLSRMAIPEFNFESLMEHLEMFLDYMSERSEELFPDTAYVLSK